MKKNFTRLVLVGCLMGLAMEAEAQAMAHQTITYLTGKREYAVYVPNTYISNKPCGLMVFLHELGGHIDNHANMAQHFANKYGWIVAMPQSLTFLNIDESVFPAGTLPAGIDQVFYLPAWNSGIGASTLLDPIKEAIGDQVSNKILATMVKVYVDVEMLRWSTTDDVKFVADMIDKVKDDYAVAEDSVFVSGMSMGGFMTHRMLIEKTGYFSAGVAVSGLIGDGIENKQPTDGTYPRVMHIHGTSDDVVGYDGVSGFFDYWARVGLSAEQTVEYWRKYDQCGVTPEVYYYPDLRNDRMTFERYTYGNGVEDNCVAFIKVNNGRHEWYDAAASKDIDYEEEIYQFCANKKATVPDVPTGVDELPYNTAPLPTKVMIDGQLYLIKGDRRYTLMGM